LPAVGDLQNNDELLSWSSVSRTSMAFTAKTILVETH